VKKLGLSTLEAAGQKVLMRVDFNVPLDKERNITDETRIVAALPSINHIIEAGGSVVLISHLGRPQGKVDAAYTLRPVADRLSELVSVPVKFASDTVGPDAQAQVASLQSGEILLLENLYGDVVSDLCAGLVGGLGVVPGANIGDDYAVFEAVHGSAPDIAGKGIANPLALLMSAVMMLNHLADTRDDTTCRDVAAKIKNAYNQTLEDGQTTGDLGGELNTKQFAKAVIERL